jgi:hypothetical protein
MDFVTLFQPAEDRDRVFNRRLADVNLLETTFERRVFFDVFLVFVERRCAYAAQLAACKRGLQHVRRVDRALGGAAPTKRVQLVDKENDLPLAFSISFSTALRRSSNSPRYFAPASIAPRSSPTKRLLRSVSGNVAGDDALGQSFDDGGLADAWFAD